MSTILALTKLLSKMQLHSGIDGILSDFFYIVPAQQFFSVEHSSTCPKGDLLYYHNAIHDLAAKLLTYRSVMRL